jgi:L-ascorbate metabolism protein UlaG (beta-lactamase superfamily)
MKRLLKTGGVLLLLMTAGCTAGTAPAEDKPGVLKATYVANEGFLIEGGGKKVLIDTLFDNGFDRYGTPPADVMRAMMAGEAPFEGVDLVLVTHRDPDHVNAQTALAYLGLHLHTRFVAHKQLVDKMRGEPGFAAVEGQIDEITANPGEQTSLTVDGIAIDALCLDHNHPADRPAETRNLAFAVTLGGARFLHMGDAQISQNAAALDAYPFDRKRIDLLFLPYWDVSAATQKLIAERIRPARIVAMHVPPSELKLQGKTVVAAYPQAVLFEKPMATAVFP